MATLAPQRSADAALARFGEPVTLPDGSVVTGVFDRHGDAVAVPWSEVGLGARLSQSQNPVLYLPEAAAVALAEGETLSIAAVALRITSIAAPRGGLTRLELMPATVNTDPEARWQ